MTRETKNLTIPSCQIIVTSLSFFQFSANLELSESQIPGTYRSSHTAALSKSTIFAKKIWFFAKKMLTSAKLRRPWYQKVHFLKLHMCVYLRTKFQASSIILTYPPLPQNEPLKRPPRLGLNGNSILSHENKKALSSFYHQKYFW